VTGRVAEDEKPKRRRGAPAAANGG